MKTGNTGITVGKKTVNAPKEKLQYKKSQIKLCSRNDFSASDTRSLHHPLSLEGESELLIMCFSETKDQIKNKSEFET